MLGMIDSVTVAISVTGIELLALKKLSLVSHALAAKIGGEAGREQKCLASTLDDLIRHIELADIAQKHESQETNRMFQAKGKAT